MSTPPTSGIDLAVSRNSRSSPFCHSPVAPVYQLASVLSNSSLFASTLFLESESSCTSCQTSNIRLHDSDVVKLCGRSTPVSFMLDHIQPCFIQICLSCALSARRLSSISHPHSPLSTCMITLLASNVTFQSAALHTCQTCVLCCHSGIKLLITMFLLCTSVNSLSSSHLCALMTQHRTYQKAPPSLAHTPRHSVSCAPHSLHPLLPFSGVDIFMRPSTFPNSQPHTPPTLHPLPFPRSASTIH